MILGDRAQPLVPRRNQSRLSFSRRPKAIETLLELSLNAIWRSNKLNDEDIARKFRIYLPVVHEICQS